MSVLLQSVLGAPILTAAVRTGAMIPTDIIPAEFQTVTDRVLGDRFGYRKRSIRASTARRVNYGNPSVRRGLVDVGGENVVMVHTNENIMHNFLTFQALTQMDNLVIQDVAREEIRQQNEEFSVEIKNLRIGVLHSVLATGTVNFDANDELLPNGTNAALSVDYGIPAGNKNQLNVFGDGNIIDTSWDNAAADIDGHIRKLDQASIRRTGMPIKYMFYGRNIPRYMQINATLKEYFVRNPQLNNAITVGGQGIPDPMYGKIWIPAYHAYYKDAAGVFRAFFNDDGFTACPAITPNWWKFAVGSFPVPTTLGNVFQTTDDAVSAAVQLVYGQFGYARLVQEDTPGLKQVAGDTFMPVITNRDAIFQAVCKF